MKNPSKKMKRSGTILCLAAALALITVGVLQHQQADVLNKAIRICLECVGIG